MRMLLAAVVMLVILWGILGHAGGMHMNPFSMVVVIVAISVFGGVFRELVKNKKEVNSTVQKDLTEVKERIAQIETDIADIKEQIADFIIKQY